MYFDPVIEAGGVVGFVTWRSDPARGLGDGCDFVMNIVVGLPKGTHMRARSFALCCIVIVAFYTARAEIYVQSTFESDTLGITITYSVVLPDVYDDAANSDRSFPVLYLLHCVGCDDGTWMRQSGANIQASVDEFQVIAAAPADDGSYRWWLDSPRIPQSRYSTFLVNEFKPLIDSVYRTLENRENTGVAGHSMGGFGAFHNALEHPGIFGSAFSIKGAFDIRYPCSQNWDGYCFGLDRLLGTDPEDAGNWDNVNILKNARELGKIDVSIGFIRSTGSPGPGEVNWFYEDNVALHDSLVSLGIEHKYVEDDSGHRNVTAELVRVAVCFFDSVVTRVDENGVYYPSTGVKHGSKAGGGSGRRSDTDHFLLNLRGQRIRSDGDLVPGGIYVKFPRNARRMPLVVSVRE